MVTDTVAFVSITTIFVLLGVMLPFINDTFGSTIGNTDVEGFKDDLGQAADNPLDAFFTVTTSVLKMFFWTFGALPFWIDAFFTMFRIILFVIIVKWVRGVSS